MKKFLTWIFLVLGVIFFVLILVGAYVYIADPLGFRQTIETSAVQIGVGNSEGGSDSTASDKNPALSATQEKALETFGIDPAAVPSSITPEQEACFIGILGEARVAEIKAGGIPTPAEYYRAKACI